MKELTTRDPQKILYLVISLVIIGMAIWIMTPLWDTTKVTEGEKKPAKVIDLKLPRVKKRSVTFRDS